MRQNTCLSWSAFLSIASPILGLTGCPSASPLPGQELSPTASPSPSATPAPATASPEPTASPAAGRKTIVIVKIGTHATDSGAHAITIRNLAAEKRDLSNWALTFEYKDSTGKDRIHARIVGPGGATLSLEPGADLTVTQAVGCTTGACIKLDETGLGHSKDVTKLGIRESHGSVGLFKDVSAPSGLTSGNLVDYLQYGDQVQAGDSSDWTYAQAAVDAKIWESSSAAAPALATLGASIVAITPGATGSANWKRE